jgi:hypothetical protein
LWVLACSTVLFLALLSIAILLPFWIFIFSDPLWHHPPIFTSLYQSFLLQWSPLCFSLHRPFFIRSCSMSNPSYSMWIYISNFICMFD